MISCSNCHHLNPDGASQCEACYAPLPAMVNCPHCQAPIRADALFCGQCGADLTPPSGEPPDEESIPTMPYVPAGSQQAGAELPPAAKAAATQVQTQAVSLLHLQTQKQIELPQGLALIHLVKPNNQVPTDIDVSGFPDSEIVSRIHANIRVEGDDFFLEDVGSSNGTYVNHIPIPPGSRYRLRAGDRIALGKGDKVTFIFQLNGLGKV